MSKEKKLIPELRFEEFENDGEWKEEKLGDCLLQKPEYGMNAPAVPFSDCLPTYLRITDISEEGNFLSEGKVSVDREVTANDYLSEGDIVLARTGASVGKSYKYRKKDGELVFAGFLIRVKPNPKRLNSELLFQFLATSNYREWVRAVSVRSGQPGINGTQYSNMPIYLPPRVEEQQKIASCLFSLDELITAHSDKLEALKNHKKGLMQNLFPQKGQKVPNYRFPGFEKDGEWKFELLGSKTIKVGSGITPRGGAKNYKSKGRPFVRSQNVGWGCLILDDIVYIDEETHYTFSTTEIEKDDVLLNITGASIGRSAVASEKIKGGNVNQHVCIIRTTNELNPFFLNQFLISKIGQNQIDSFQAGGNRQGLNFGQIRSFSIPQPPDTKEQQKISSGLSALDELITAQSEKIEQLQQHKKGLMQGLFPSTTEIK